MAKEGIKLSNLHLRDGNGKWWSLGDAYIGDILGGDVTAEQLGNWMKKVSNNSGGSLDIDKLFFQKVPGQNSTLQLRYDTGDNTSVLITEVSISEIDTNTKYSLEKQNLTESGVTGDYLVFTSTDYPDSPTKILLPTGSECEFEASEGTGYFNNVTGSGSSSGSGSGGSGGSYSGDGKTISITDRTISLYYKGGVPVNNSTVQLSYGQTFSAISAINVDNYGRVASITLTNYKMPDASSIVENPTFLDTLNEAINSKIDETLRIS